MNRKAYKQLMSAFVVLTMLAAAFVMAAQVAGNGSEGVLMMPESDLVDVKKTAAYAGDGKWDITLTVDGRNAPLTTDIVFVVDCSFSMREKITLNGILYGTYDLQSNMNKIKVALKDIADSLIPTENDGKVRLGVIGYNSDVYTYSELTSDKSAFGTGVDELKIGAFKGSFIQGGIKAAETMLDASDADQKVMVVVSDGEATYAYGLKTPLNDNDYYLYDTTAGYKTYYSKSNLTADRMTNERIGNGLLTRDTNLKWMKSYSVIFANQAISEAKIASGKDISVYSVGFKADNDAKQSVVRSIGVKDSFFASDIDSLTVSLKKIADKTVNTGVNAEIIDPIGDMFSLVGDASNITVTGNGTSYGNITYEDGVISVNFPVISEVYYPIIVKYQVLIDTQTAVFGETYPANGDTFLYFSKANTYYCNQFVVPWVGIDCVRVTLHHVLVDGNANLVGIGSGTNVDNFADAQIMEEYYNVPVNEDYTLAAYPAFTFNDRMFAFSDVTSLNGGALTADSSPKTLNIAETKDMYFAYTELTDFAVTFHNNAVDPEQTYVQTMTDSFQLESFANMGFANVGYEFAGWCTTGDAGIVEFDDEESFTFAMYSDLYAVWNPIEYTVHYIDPYEHDLDTMEGVKIGDEISFNVEGFVPYNGVLNAELIENAIENAILINAEPIGFSITLTLSRGVAVEGVSDGDSVNPYSENPRFLPSLKAGYQNLRVEIYMGGVRADEMDMIIASAAPKIYSVDEEGWYTIYAWLVTDDIEIRVWAVPTQVAPELPVPEVNYYNVSVAYNTIYVAVSGIPDNGVIRENGDLNIRIAPAGAPVKVHVTVTMGGADVTGAFAYDSGSEYAGNVVIAAVTGDVAVNVSYEEITTENPTDVGQFPWWLILVAVIVGLILLLVYYRSRKNEQTA